MSDLKPCPFCGSIPEFGPIYDPDERRHMDMDLECCVTMTARISYPKYTAMNSFALKDTLQAELTKEWNRRTQPEAAAPAIQQPQGQDRGIELAFMGVPPGRCLHEFDCDFAGAHWSIWRCRHCGTERRR